MRVKLDDAAKALLDVIYVTYPEAAKTLTHEALGPWWVWVDHRGPFLNDRPLLPHPFTTMRHEVRACPVDPLAVARATAMVEDPEGSYHVEGLAQILTEAWEAERFGEEDYLEAGGLFFAVVLFADAAEEARRRGN